MSLQYIAGPSGSGKSHMVYNMLTEAAANNTDKRYFIVVPDQFTMETQRQLCDASPSGGILNIEVMSFGRLAHRVFEELGIESLPRLDDTGKNLVLRKVAAIHRDELMILGNKINNMGYISSIKSVISEFAQYGKKPEDVEELCKTAENRGLLKAKLHDLAILYKGYKDYIQGNYITIEENIDILIRSISESELMKNSVVIFDGYTGFTPIQESLLKELMIHSEKVVVTLLADGPDDLYKNNEEHSLFYMSYRTRERLNRIASENGISIDEDIFVERRSGSVRRFEQNPVLSHLERNLFRFKTEKPYRGMQDNLVMCTLKDPRRETEWVCMNIRRLIREKGYKYRDFAVVTGDLKTYGLFIKESFEKHGIPVFIDRNAGLTFHPFMLFLSGLIKLFTSDFSYEAASGVIKSGFLPVSDEDADAFCEYVKAYGIRGKRAYGRLFVKGASEKEDILKERRERAEKVRLMLWDSISPLNSAGKNAGAITEALYEICLKINAEKTLEEMAEEQRVEGDLSGAKEFEQVFGAVIGLFDQIHALLEEDMDLKEYGDILKAGFSELKVGSLPQGVDTVAAGDMERTRLKPVKVLFIIGLNDGVIPAPVSEGGLLSEPERHFLSEANVELKPDPARKSFEARLYIYMNMTQPSDALYVSYSENDLEGKAVRPSYVAGDLKKLFENLDPVHKDMNGEEMIETPVMADEVCSVLLREYVSGAMKENDDKKRLLLKLLADGGVNEKLLDAAFIKYEPSVLSDEMAKKIYGEVLNTSVSRLELFSKCAYAHFLSYALRLKEEEEYSFEAKDLGTLYHDVLYSFGMYLKEKGYTWETCPEEERDAFVEKRVEEFATENNRGILYDSLRSEALKERVKDLLKINLGRLVYQIKKGAFAPEEYEADFSTGKISRLHGKIDRTDVAEKDGKRYVKIIDYKSGSTDFSEVDLYYGLSLQLSVYMNAACEAQRLKKGGEEVIPAALFYHQVKKPLLSVNGSITDEDLDERLRNEYRLKGLIRGEKEVIDLLDGEAGDASDVVCAGYKKDGSIKASKTDVVDPELFDNLLEFAKMKAEETGERIISGEKEISPLEDKDKKVCRYCEYRGICGFDENVPGFKRRKRNIKTEDAVSRMMKAVGANEDETDELH